MAEDWLKELGKSWGRSVAAFERDAGNTVGTLGRIRSEGFDGVSAREYGGKIPYREFPKNVRRFHRAWIGLDPHHQAILFVAYRVTAPIESKFEALRLGKNAYYRRLDRALAVVARRMALGENPE